MTKARIDFAKKIGSLPFDADVTNATALLLATTESGYLSAVRK